jgi:CheY-like chemotaxis protein
MTKPIIPILYADDNEICRMAFEGQAIAFNKNPKGQCTYECTIVSSGQDAVTQFEQRYYPIVVTDYHMLVNYNGIDTAQKILEIAAKNFTNMPRPIIIVYSDDQQVQDECKKNNCIFFSKPTPSLFESITQTAEKNNISAYVNYVAAMANKNS